MASWDNATRVSKRATIERATCLTTVGIEVQGVKKRAILVDHVGVPTDALNGFASGQFSGKKELHAAADDERVFVLQVQASQFGEIAPRPVAHVPMVTIPNRLSTCKSQANGEFCRAVLPVHVGAFYERLW